MPKLTLTQWLIVAAIQLFYGFAVFALTRDYYQRHPAVASAPGRTVHPGTPAATRSLQPSGGGSAIPESVVRKDPILLAQLGDEHFQQRRYREAIDIYRRVLELDPDDVDTYNDLGLALHYSGDSSRALAVLKKGVEKDPEFQRIWLTLGFVQSHTDERGEAGFSLREAIRLDPRNQVGGEAERMLESLSNKP